jgi:alginate O-acetyltransferase complex protein AlgI
VLVTSFTFLFVFFPVVLLLWWVLRGSTLRLVLLALASYVFYAWWDWRFLPLLWIVTVSDYVIGRRLARPGGEQSARRRLLVLSLCVDLGLLGFFKYTGFFLDSLNGISSLVGAGLPLPVLRVVLPIGISFYTFDSLSYTIDLYRRKVQPADGLLQYAAYVSMFPYLLAGPIERFTQMGDQLRRLPRRLDGSLAASGLAFAAFGLAKKLVIADQLAPSVARLFAAHSHLGVVSGWAAAVGFSLQLYFDFSGYSDIAVGVGLLLGLRLPQNFDSPYTAVNVSDFWRRWHMSLSSWVRDYVYISLGGSRVRLARNVLNLMITMTVMGLWHGAAWTFVVWGALHGAALSVRVLARRAHLALGITWLNRALTFGFVAAAFVIFRSPDLRVAGDVLAAMAGLKGLEPLASLRALVGGGFAAALLALLVFVNVVPNTWHLKVRPRVWQAVALGVLAAAAVLLINKPSPFLYFQF